METFSVLLALCGFPSQRSVTRNFDVFFDLRLYKQLNKQSRRLWFETSSRSLWRHCNVHAEAQSDGPHFTDDTFKCITLYERIWTSLKVSLKFMFVPKNPIDNLSATSKGSPNFLRHICVIVAQGSIIALWGTFRCVTWDVLWTFITAVQPLFHSTKHHLVKFSR